MNSKHALVVQDTRAEFFDLKPQETHLEISPTQNCNSQQRILATELFARKYWWEMKTTIWASGLCFILNELE
jgi:hypothetical protein